MAEKDNRLPAGINIRTITFAFMFFAVATTVYFQGELSNPEQKEVGTGKGESLKFRMMASTAAYVDIASEVEKEQFTKNLEKELENLAKRTSLISGDRIVQKSVILEYIGVELKKLNIRPLTEKSTELEKDFHKLYIRKEVIPESSPLFKTESGNLALIRLYNLNGEQVKLKALKEKVHGAARQLIWFQKIVLFFFLSLFLGNFVLLFRIMRKKPIPLFPAVLQKIPANLHRLLIETPIFFLFLFFPIGGVLLGALMGALGIKFPNQLLLSVAIIPSVFLAAMYFFNKYSGEPKILKRFIYSGERKNIFREVIWGGLGYVAIFPPAIMVMVVSLGLFDESIQDGGSRAMHPIANHLGEHPYLVFFLAVILAPITEELIFRNFVFGFFRRFMPLFSSALITGVCFAVLHPQGAPALPSLAAIGMGLCILREYRPGVIAPIITHMLINTTSLVMAYYTLQVL